MPKIMGPTVVLASVSLLVLGGCATTGVRDIRSNSGDVLAPSALPSTSSEPWLQFNRQLDLKEIPQAL